MNDEMIELRMNDEMIELRIQFTNGNTLHYEGENFNVNIFEDAIRIRNYEEPGWTTQFFAHSMDSYSFRRYRKGEE